MNMLVLPLSILAYLMVMVPGQFVAAADRPTPSVVTIEGMHCVACSKAVIKKLQRVSDVAEVAVDVKTGLATVSPVRGKALSARSLWEAVEASGYRPTRLQGPSGTFTSKPEH